SEIINLYSIPTINSLLDVSISISSFVIMLGKTLQTVDNQEVTAYIEMVKSGDSYKRVFTKMYPDEAYDKADAKVKILTMFFVKNSPKLQSRIDFKKAFPEIYKLFALIKKDNHTTLSHILQRIESEIIIQRVTKRISIEKP